MKESKTNKPTPTTKRVSKMATGERTFSLSGPAVKFQYEPVPPGEYMMKILGNTAEVRKNPEPGKFAYVAFQGELLDTATTEGGKNRKIFPMLFLNLNPGKDGTVNPMRESGLAGLCGALGLADEDRPNFRAKDAKDKDGNEVEVLDALQVRDWVKQQDGQVVKVYVAVRKRPDGTPDSQLQKYIEAEASSSSDSSNESEEAEEEVEDLEETETDEDGEEDVEEEEVEEEPAPVRRVAKAAPKVAAKVTSIKRTASRR